MSAGAPVTRNNIGIVGGALYDVELDLLRSAGTFGLRLGSTNPITNTATLSASGNYAWSLIAHSTLDTIRIVALTVGATGSFSRISAKRYLGRYGRALTDAARPTLKNSGTTWWLNKAGSEALKLWCPGGLTGATIGYANESGVTILANQTVAADAELLYGERTYGVVLINRTLTSGETAGLQAYLAALRTGGVPEEEPQPDWVPLGTATLSTFKHRFDSVTGPYTIRATGANAVVATFETQSGSTKATDLTALGLTVPATLEIEGAAMADPNLVHITLGNTGLGGAFPDLSKLSGLKQFYCANNPKTGQTLPALQSLPVLETVWLHGCGASAWGSTAIPATVKDLRVYDNGMSQATVNAILTQANTALLGTGDLIDLGGNNANASSAGWDTRDALVSRGATVNLSGADPRAAAPVGLKWFPGHYYLSDKYDAAPIQDDLNLFKDYPIVRGMLKRYKWFYIEPTKDNYNIAAIKADLDACHALGKKMIVQVQIKSFNPTAPFVPVYMRTPEYAGGYYASKTQTAPRLWEPSVKARLDALIVALSELDDHPALVVVALPESGPAKPEPDSPLFANWAWYLREYFKSLSELNALAPPLFPKTPFVQYFTAGATEIAYWEPLFKEHAVGIGGPDTWVGAYIHDAFIVDTYNLVQRLKGKVPVVFSVQDADYIQTTPKSSTVFTESPENPIQQIFNFSRNTLGSNIIAWQRRNTPHPFWDRLREFWTALPTTYPGDPAGGLPSAVPSLLKE